MILRNVDSESLNGGGAWVLLVMFLFSLLLLLLMLLVEGGGTDAVETTAVLIPDTISLYSSRARARLEVDSWDGGGWYGGESLDNEEVADSVEPAASFLATESKRDEPEDDAVVVGMTNRGDSFWIPSTSSASFNSVNNTFSN
jgi:hypothetical protein